MKVLVKLCCLTWPHFVAFSHSKEKRLYEPMSLDEELEEEVLYARALYNPGQGVATRDVFFFADGAVVFWNMAESEHKAIFEMLADVTETVGEEERGFF